MTKEELITLLERTLQDIPQEIDEVYRIGRLYGGLSSLKIERVEALKKLTEAIEQKVPLIEL